MQGQLPADVEAALILATFIEAHRFDVLQAQQRLSDRAAQAKLIHKTESSQSRANDMKSRIDVLENAHPTIVRKIDRLKARTTSLLN